ncbi:MAG TPA: polysaccharide deacetylase family protein [Pyrinomonadaceae bacterium]|jgi:peptidoglycan/xylan/chitin deacetylase (PgdA/CDA1 family)|nr:polysaccharide deacetylase family protein [Pyrinomonadaceae bacterium]
MLNKLEIKRAIKQSLAWVSLAPRLSNTVLLTFDDGPHPESTPAALRLLKQYNARAVFFVVGSRIERAPHLLKTILDEGHAIGNHSYSHPLDNRTPFGSYLKDLARCQDSIEQLTGERPTFFRPPLGLASFTSLVAPRMLGLTTMLWSIDADDWDLKSEEEAQAAAKRLGEKLHASPTRNDIVLMHDDHPYVPTILETILPQLANQNCDLYSALDSIQKRSAA